MGIGYGLKGFAGGFATGIGLGLENKKIKMIKEEQERAEKLAKEKEENAMDWYNTNKDTLVNFQTQPQDTRNMLIFESTKYSDDWNDYLRDMENAKQAGDFEELKHLNDIAEEKIKAERDMLGFGVTAENGFIGKHYTEEDMDYVKKLRMGALTNKPIGTKMYEESFGELPPETKEITFNEKRFNWKIEQHSQGRITLNQLLESEGISMSPEKATGLEKSIQDIRTEGERAGIDPAKIDKAIQDKILGTSEGTLTPTPQSVETVRESILKAPTLEDAKRIEKNHIAKYGDTTGIPNVDKFWSDERVRRLDSLKQSIDNKLLVDRGDKGKWLNKGTITSDELGFGEKNDEFKMKDAYQSLREEYMKYREMLEKMGVDVSQYPKLKPLSEIERVGGTEGFFGLGIEKGDYKSIYY